LFWIHLFWITLVWIPLLKISLGEIPRAGVPLVWTPLAGIPLVQRTVETLCACESVDALAVVVNADRVDELQALKQIQLGTKVVAVVPGGDERSLETHLQRGDRVRSEIRLSAGDVRTVGVLFDVQDDECRWMPVQEYLTHEEASVDDLVGMSLRCGETKVKAMELLDAGNTEAYGHPEPTQVRIDPVKGKCILVSGHDLLDLAELLEQTRGKGVNVYTHCEMLPAHGYPGLKKYDHLVGNYGSAWQDQAKDFDAFPGAILMTTNCIQKPRDSYEDRIFTSGPVGWPGVRHVGDRNFAPVIEAALSAEGFTADGPGVPTSKRISGRNTQ